jgi:DNA-binding GntR family transcriptional regulator
VHDLKHAVGEPWQVPSEMESALRRPGGTVRERALRILRERILLGDLAAGSRIDLDAVAEEFGTSRTPIREACLALAGEGLVRVAPRSGITVIGVTAEDTVENFAMMAVLSGVAAAWAAERITPPELRVVRDLRNAIVSAVQSQEDPATANWSFHSAINRASGSPRLVRMLSQTGRMIPMSFFSLFPEQIPCSLDEHDSLVSALEARDPVAARNVTERHFAAPGRLLAVHLSPEGIAPATKILLDPEGELDTAH